MSTDAVALYSGGKDSYLAVAEAERSGYAVDRLVTVDAPPGSYLYHVPTTAATAVVAEAMDREHVPLTLDAVAAESSAAAARSEVRPLADWLEGIVGTPAQPSALVSGVVASRYQYDLLASLCDDVSLDLVTPLWDRSPAWILEQIRERPLAVDVVGVAAEGLDRDWLGRRLDGAAIDELEVVAERHGLHPAGEGGEFETLVVDAPAFAVPIRYRATPVWEGTHGHLELTDVWRADATAQAED